MFCTAYTVEDGLLVIMSNTNNGDFLWIIITVIPTIVIKTIVGLKNHAAIAIFAATLAVTHAAIFAVVPER
jgi:hypothetical protein